MLLGYLLQTESLKITVEEGGADCIFHVTKALLWNITVIVTFQVSVYTEIFKCMYM